MITLSLFTAFFIYMLDYGLGHPADDKQGYGSFLFPYSLWLSKRALKDLYPPIEAQYKEQLKAAGNALERQQIKRSFQEIVFTQGRQLFTWQKVIGMCPYCTHFWFTLIIFIFCFKLNILNLHILLWFVISHAILRILKKYA